MSLTCILFVTLTILSISNSSQNEKLNKSDHHKQHDYNECNIPTLHLDSNSASLTALEFDLFKVDHKVILPNIPYIIKRSSFNQSSNKSSSSSSSSSASSYSNSIFLDSNELKSDISELITLSGRSHLIERYNDIEVDLTSSNTYSQGKSRLSLHQFITQYVDNIITPINNETIDKILSETESSQSSSILSNETLYLFGNNYDVPLFQHMGALYTIPSCSYCETAGVKSVGLGGKMSGVSWHFHGPGFSEVMHGRKEWFLFPPHIEIPGFHPNMSMAAWKNEYFYDLLLNSNNNNNDDDDVDDSSADITNNKYNNCTTDTNQSITSCISDTHLSLHGIDECDNDNDNDDNNNNNDHTTTTTTSSTTTTTTTTANNNKNKKMYNNSNKNKFNSNLKKSLPHKGEIIKTEFYHCILEIGDILYFPDRWMHATLNLDEYNFFISLFLDTQLIV